MIYCINPWCHGRINEDSNGECASCRSPLLINDRFKLLKPLFDLNRTHFCDVYEALDTTGSWLSPPGTIKILKVLKEYDDDNKLVSLMEKEAEALQLLNHPAIPKSDLDDFFSVNLEYGPGELYCLAMTKFEGVTLETWIQQNGKINQPLALDWFRQLIQILDVVHLAGINKLFDGFIHRDIKPSNIMVQPDNQLALIDFGGVRKTSNTYYAKLGGGNRDRLTQLGTLGYTAPEQQDGRAVLQSDFYSLGYTFINLLTGRAFGDIPRDENTGLLLWQQYAKQIDKPFLQCIEGMTSPAIARRPKNTKEILSFLDETLPKQLRWHGIFRSRLFQLFCLFLIIPLLLVLSKPFSLYQYRNHLSIGNMYMLQKNDLIDKKKDYIFAKANYEEALRYKPNDITALNNRGTACEALKDYACAIDSYRQATLSQPSWESYLNLASHYDDRQDYVMARKYYQMAIQQSNRQEAAPLNNLARLEIIAKNYQSAQILIDEGLKHVDNPTTEAALLKNAAWINVLKSEYLTAEHFLDKIDSLKQERTDVYCMRSLIAEARKNAAEYRVFAKACMRVQLDDAGSPEVEQWRSEILDHL